MRKILKNENYYWEIEANLYNELVDLKDTSDIEKILKIYFKDYLGRTSFSMLDKLPKGIEKISHNFNGFDTKERHVVEWLASKKIKYYNRNSGRKIFDILENYYQR